MNRMKCFITGKVQGVNFRNFVSQKARGIGCAGYVKNVPERAVEVVAQGTDEQLEKLVEHLHKGPFLARVSNVDVEWLEPDETLVGFQVLY